MPQPDNKKKKEQQFINRKLPEYWKFSIFYYNKNDKSVIVKARYGFGFAFNYAHKTTKIGLVIVGLAVIALIVAVALQ